MAQRYFVVPMYTVRDGASVYNTQISTNFNDEATATKFATELNNAYAVGQQDKVTELKKQKEEAREL